jgi:hypothetical protein
VRDYVVAGLVGAVVGGVLALGAIMAWLKWGEVG